LKFGVPVVVVVAHVAANKDGLEVPVHMLQKLYAVLH
jgi:hypothetical protein